MTASRFTSARQVFDAFPMIVDDLTVGPSEDPPLDFLARLAASPSPEDAITFCAYLLDKRQAVWWACRSLRHMGMPRGPAEDVAIKLAEAWVRDPEEHRRVAALQYFFGSDHKLATVWLTLAAGLAGGTMKIGEIDGPPVPQQGTATAARTAVLGGLATLPARARRDTIAACVAMARELLASAGRG